jgi:hypothetical protein
MEDLLKDLGVRDETLALDDASLQQPLRFDFVRMSGADQEHRDV